MKGWDQRQRRASWGDKAITYAPEFPRAYNSVTDASRRLSSIPMAPRCSGKRERPSRHPVSASRTFRRRAEALSPLNAALPPQNSTIVPSRGCRRTPDSPVVLHRQRAPPPIRKHGSWSGGCHTYRWRRASWRRVRGGPLRSLPAETGVPVSVSLLWEGGKTDLGIEVDWV